MLRPCSICHAPVAEVVDLDGLNLVVNQTPDPDGAFVLKGNIAEQPLALIGVDPDGDTFFRVPRGALRYRQHDCPQPAEDEHDEAEAYLSTHADHCVANAVRAAVDHGIDDPSALRVVAYQLMEVNRVRCTCADGPGEFDFPHVHCVPTKLRMLVNATGFDPTTFRIEEAHPPYQPGDLTVWDCPHGFVYRNVYRAPDDKAGADMRLAGFPIATVDPHEVEADVDAIIAASRAAGSDDRLDAGIIDVEQDDSGTFRAPHLPEG